MTDHRRDFLLGATGFGLVATLPGLVTRADDKKKEEEEDISAPEDLMREHGLLNRILLIFEEGLRRLLAGKDVPPEVFHQPATLVRSFVEDYHEKLEEKFIFPQFEKAKKHVGLVTTLRKQHEGGRGLTDVILAGAKKLKNTESRSAVAGACEAFIRMYRPHEAREDTVLFPALYKIVSAKQVKELGEMFEKEEHRLFGGDGFEKNVEKVAALEKQLGIHDLDQFTPKK
jgi:hemerythrin-like domain-containing protein